MKYSISIKISKKWTEKLHIDLFGKESLEHEMKEDEQQKGIKKVLLYLDQETN